MKDSRGGNISVEEKLHWLYKLTIFLILFAAVFSSKHPQIPMKKVILVTVSVYLSLLGNGVHNYTYFPANF